MPDRFRKKFGDLANMATFTISGDKDPHVYRKNGAAIEEAPLSVKSLGEFKPTTTTLNPLTEVMLWPAQEGKPLH